MIRILSVVLGAILSVGLLSLPARSQAPGVFSPLPGLQITTAFTNAYGPDSESVTSIVGTNSMATELSYVSSRGLSTRRSVLNLDRLNSRVLVLGFAPKMPQVIAGTTTLSISSATLNELRTVGQAPFALIYDASLSSISGYLKLAESNLSIDILVAGQTAHVPMIRAVASFRKGNKTAEGEFFILDDPNSPTILQYRVKFSWEAEPRTERVVLVETSNSQEAVIELALQTLRRQNIYGILFDFDKASIRPEAASVLTALAHVLDRHPQWTLLIKGHTDSIGGADYNLRLSHDRAESVKAFLAQRLGISPVRLTTVGVGMSEPRAPNDSLQGRKLNRRVEVVRTDP